jgi:hypothetical protein
MPDSRTNVESINATAVANHYDLPQLTLRLDQAWRILNLNQELIRSADQKTYLLIVMSTLLVTYVSTNLDKIMRHGMVEKVGLVLFLVAGAAFFYFALSTLLARARKSPSVSTQIPNLIFFSDIAQRASPNDYAESFHRASLSDVLDDVCHQIHQVANIAGNKYRAYRRAWIALLIEVSMFLLLEFSIIL